MLKNKVKNVKHLVKTQNTKHKTQNTKHKTQNTNYNIKKLSIKAMRGGSATKASSNNNLADLIYNKKTVECNINYKGIILKCTLGNNMLILGSNQIQEQKTSKLSNFIPVSHCITVKMYKSTNSADLQQFFYKVGKDICLQSKNINGHINNTTFKSSFNSSKQPNKPPYSKTINNTLLDLIDIININLGIKYCVVTDGATITCKDTTNKMSLDTKHITNGYGFYNSFGFLYTNIPKNKVIVTEEKLKEPNAIIIDHINFSNYILSILYEIATKTNTIVLSIFIKSILDNDMSAGINRNNIQILAINSTPTSDDEKEKNTEKTKNDNLALTQFINDLNHELPESFFYSKPQKLLNSEPQKLLNSEPQKLLNLNEICKKIYSICENNTTNNDIDTKIRLPYYLSLISAFILVELLNKTKPEQDYIFGNSLTHSLIKKFTKYYEYSIGDNILLKSVLLTDVSIDVPADVPTDLVTPIPIHNLPYKFAMVEHKQPNIIITKNDTTKNLQYIINIAD